MRARVRKHMRLLIRLGMGATQVGVRACAPDQCSAAFEQQLKLFFRPAKTAVRLPGLHNMQPGAFLLGAGGTRTWGAAAEEASAMDNTWPP